MDWSLFWSASLGYLFGVILKSAVVWLPLTLAYLWWVLRLDALRIKTITSQKPVLLEVKLPKEIFKSPQAMELVITSLSFSGAATYLETYLKGKIKPWSSLEIVSIGGDVKFYFWLQDPGKKNTVESQIYAQYPGVEVREVPDYTLEAYDPEKYNMWAGHFKLSSDNVLPIKTYVDYGLDKNPKEEHKVDPITVMLEYLGSLRPGEQCWIQILIQAHGKEGLKDGRLYEKASWVKAGEKKIEEIMKKATPPDSKGPPNLTPGQVEIIKAIERDISKIPFETMVRGLYIATKEAFNPSNIGGMIGTFRQYNAANLNGFKIGWNSDHKALGKDLVTLFGFIPWFNNHMTKRKLKQERALFDAYRKRSFFYWPYAGLGNDQSFIMNTEELATIFHFPGQVAGTPTLGKIESKRAEPPVNLPI